MGFLDKVKNMFVEEIEDDEPIKKEVIQVEIPSPKGVEEIPEKEEIVEEKKEEKFVFPVYFDDKDFEKIEKTEEPKPVPKKVEPAPKREAYGIKKEEKIEKKVFKPTPIISPVYGVLDKNYRKEEIKTKKRPVSAYRSEESIDVDDVRNKAYGTLENEIENNLFEKTSILFNDEVENEEINDDLIDVFEEPRHGAKEDLKPTLEEVSESEFATDELIEEELNKDYEEQPTSYVDELNDSELFNLIDSMYEKKDDE